MQSNRPLLRRSAPMDPLHVVAVPYPGRGHINPMMVLCRLLADRGLLITFVVTEEWLALLASSSPPPPPNVRLRAIPNVIPSESGRGADFFGFLEAVYTKMEEPFERLLDRLEPPPVAIVADTYLPWAAVTAGRRGIPACSVFTMSAAFFSVLCQFDRIGDASEEADEPLEKYVPGLTSVHLSELQSIFAGMEDPKKKAMGAISWARKAHCILFTSFYELEPCVIDALRSELSCPLYPVGPSIPYMMLQENPTKPLQHDDYYEWLDSQPQCSVLYISLGSFLSVSALQMDEIAAGLMASGTRFLWVARESSSRMQEMSSRAGLVLPWCDQLRVLCHPSIGGFLTHCGWNSTLEAVFAGVPMIVFPIFWDQVLDGRLVVDEWKVGLRVREGKEFVGRAEIAKVVKRLMEDEEMRKRSLELRDVCRGAIGAGGSLHDNLDSFVRDLINGHGC